MLGKLPDSQKKVTTSLVLNRNQLHNLKKRPVPNQRNDAQILKTFREIQNRNSSNINQN